MKFTTTGIVSIAAMVLCAVGLWSCNNDVWYDPDGVHLSIGEESVIHTEEKEIFFSITSGEAPFTITTDEYEISEIGRKFPTASIFQDGLDVHIDLLNDISEVTIRDARNKKLTLRIESSDERLKYFVFRTEIAYTQTVYCGIDFGYGQPYEVLDWFNKDVFSVRQISQDILELISTEPQSENWVLIQDCTGIVRLGYFDTSAGYDITGNTLSVNGKKGQMIVFPFKWGQEWQITTIDITEGWETELHGTGGVFPNPTFIVTLGDGTGYFVFTDSNGDTVELTITAN